MKKAVIAAIVVVALFLAAGFLGLKYDDIAD